ncbi:MAG: hypothetical protein H0X37_17370 [Herpetosiphonaceae bacterium]|nr:hypothetical protein [Herpetosiphonaceae bacterium]
MDELELIETLNGAVHKALLNNYHTLSEHQLLELSDQLLVDMPTLGGTAPTAAVLLRHYHSTLHRELCIGQTPRSIPYVIEDEVRMLTRAVMVAIETQEGIPVDASVLLALTLRARGIDKLCAMPVDRTSPA